MKTYLVKPQKGEFDFGYEEAVLLKDIKKMVSKLKRELKSKEVKYKEGYKRIQLHYSTYCKIIDRIFS